MLANALFGLRVSPEEELVGADYSEHGIGKDIPLAMKKLLRRYDDKY